MEVLLNITMKINGFLKEKFEKGKWDAFTRCLEIIKQQHRIFHQLDVTKTANTPYP